MLVCAANPRLSW